MFFVFLVCAICDGRQHICENLGRLRHFSILTYLFILIQVLEVFLFETISYMQTKLHGENHCAVPLPMCIGSQTYLL